MKIVGTIKNIWKIEDLRTKLGITILFILIYRFGSFIVLPGIDPASLADLKQQTSGGLLSLLDMFSGGAFSKVFLLSGGPGQDTLQTYAALASSLVEIRQRRGMVLVDQRSTGGSNRLDCPMAPGTDMLSMPPQTRR